MSDSKMREEFEAWAFQCAWLGLSDECMARDEINGGYYGLELHASWLAWQASRAALVIELPDADGLNREHMLVQGFLEGVAHAKAAIESAGVRVKP